MSQSEESAAFDRVNGILDRLLAPDGCPWDRAQTMLSLRKTLLEETCELIEAIDLNDNEHIKEELGDLVLNALLLCKMAEKENRSTMQAVFHRLAEKLIYRHPHIFGSATVANAEHALEQWEALKKGEEGKEKRSSLLDGIPSDLPALARAHKMARRMRKTDFTPPDGGDEESELQFGFTLWKLLQSSSYEPEQALRAYLAACSKSFRSWEAKERKEQESE